MRSLFTRLLRSKPAATAPVWHAPGVVKRVLAIFKLDILKNAPSSSRLIIASRMEITKDSFGTHAVRLLQDIADSHFVAFDFEFSGTAERDRNRIGKATIEDRYEETRASVQDFQPLQIGLTIVKVDEVNGRYVLEPYNLNISPVPLLRERQFMRKWSMSSGAVSFLQKNGFDFGKQLVHGVPYLSLQEEEQARTKMTADSKRDDMVLKPHDQDLVQHVRDSITEWQSQPIEEQEEWLNIPHGQRIGIPGELNGYQRRLVHQIVQNEFPAMKTQGMGHFIQITNPTLEKQASQKQLEDEYRERDLARAIGLRWIVDGITGRDLSNLPHDYVLPALPQTVNAAEGEKPVKAFVESLTRKLQERRKVLIGHNCMTDVMYLYKMTVGDLPATLKQFKGKVHDMFPAIIDTKYLSSCFSEKHGRLALGEVIEDLSRDSGIAPEFHVPPEFDRYASGTYLHEAGYDSYITAILAIKMASKLQRYGSSRKKDHDRQVQEVAEAAADHPPDLFGVQDGYVTAAEEPANDINGSAPVHHNTTPTSVIAVKSMASPSAIPRNKPVDWKDEDQVASLRSAFSSTSIYDTLGDTDAMPGEEQPQQETLEEDTQQRMDRLVKEGRMMPRWAEEGAFWDFYGNKLQVNGTVEGVLDILD